MQEKRSWDKINELFITNKNLFCVSVSNVSNIFITLSKILYYIISYYMNQTFSLTCGSLSETKVSFTFLTVNILQVQTERKQRDHT